MKTSLVPFSIRLFVPSGDPDGLRVVDKSNWTGIGVVFNRSDFRQAIDRPEFERTGIYVLVGADPEGVLPNLYIGEGEPVGRRLQRHQANKDFWNWAVFFVSKDSSLNKAHVKYLESRLIDLAQAAKQCHLENLTGSQAPTLSEAETADIEGFLHQMLSIFPLIGLNAFDPPAPTEPLGKTILYIEAKGIRATGHEDSGGFVVHAGSQVVTEETNSCHQYMRNFRATLKKQGVIADDQSGCYWVFSQDHAFNSPSTAAGVIQGRAANGRLDWKTSEGTTLKELQIAAAEDDHSNQGNEGKQSTGHP